jgi:hypothetical protein
VTTNLFSFNMDAIADCTSLNTAATCDDLNMTALSYAGTMKATLLRVSSTAALVSAPNGHAYKAILVGGHSSETNQFRNASTVLSLHIEKRQLQVNKLLADDGTPLSLRGVGLLGAQVAYAPTHKTLFVYGGYNDNGFQDKLYQAEIETCQPGYHAKEAWQLCEPDQKAATKKKMPIGTIIGKCRSVLDREKGTG